MKEQIHPINFNETNGGKKDIIIVAADGTITNVGFSVRMSPNGKFWKLLRDKRTARHNRIANERYGNEYLVIDHVPTHRTYFVREDKQREFFENYPDLQG